MYLVDCTRLLFSIQIHDRLAMAHIQRLYTLGASPLPLALPGIEHVDRLGLGEACDGHAYARPLWLLHVG